MKQFTAGEWNAGVERLAPDDLQLALQNHGRTHRKREVEIAGVWQN